MPVPPRLMLDISIPMPNNDDSTYEVPPKTFRVNINAIDNFADFVDRLRAQIPGTTTQSHIGWRSCDDTKKMRRRLAPEDVKGLIDIFTPLLTSTRRQKPVFMEAFDCVCLLFRSTASCLLKFLQTKVPEKQAPAEKVTETAITKELDIVKAKLGCMEHRGNNRWCFVRRDEEHAGQHIALGLEKITLWARKMVSKIACCGLRDVLINHYNMTALLPKTALTLLMSLNLMISQRRQKRGRKDLRSAKVLSKVHLRQQSMFTLVRLVIF